MIIWIHNLQFNSLIDAVVLFIPNTLFSIANCKIERKTLK